jgi:transcriptional regulator with XRE-family HTH domain
MNNNKREEIHQKIGNELSEARKSRAIRLEEISKQTKISRAFLKKLESGELDFLPSLYVKAFLRAFAEALELDGEKLVLEYEQARILTAQESEEEAAGSQSNHDQEGVSFTDVFGKLKNVLNRSVIWLLTLSLAVIVLLFLLWPQGEDSKTKQVQEIEIPRLSDAIADSVAQQSPDIAPAKMLNLNIVAKESTWMKIIYDDTISEEVMFLPGDSREWESQVYYLKIGNVPGLDLKVDGKTLVFEDSLRRVENIRIDENGVESISDSQFPR